MNVIFKKWENNEIEEIGLVTPTHLWSLQENPINVKSLFSEDY